MSCNYRYLAIIKVYRNAKSAAALVNPLIAQAVEVLHVQFHF